MADIGYLFLYSVSSFLHPFLTHFDCLAFCGVSGGVMKGDNASSAEDIDFAFLVSCSLFQADGMCCLSFSFISPAFIFDPFLSFFPSVSLPALFFSFFSTFPFMQSTHTHYLSFLLFLRSWCSGGDSQCSTLCSDRWCSGAAGFHCHLCPHCHHLVLCPTER